MSMPARGFGETAFNEEQIALLATFCASQNPRFNRERWLDYIAGKCGPSGGAVKPKYIAWYKGVRLGTYDTKQEAEYVEAKARREESAHERVS